MVILSTIQTQDFADVEGDKMLNRTTLPIAAPNASRSFTAFALLAWSAVSARVWELGQPYAAALMGVALYVSGRIFFLRSVQEDKLSYTFYNVSDSCGDYFSAEILEGNKDS
jgi:hypothetical protein